MNYTWLSVRDARRNIGWVPHDVNDLCMNICLVRAMCDFLSCQISCWGQEKKHAEDSFYNQNSIMKTDFHNCVSSSRPIVFHLVELSLPTALYLYREAIDLNGASVPSE